jgi:hypothetical protein
MFLDPLADSCAIYKLLFLSSSKQAMYVTEGAELLVTFLLPFHALPCEKVQSFNTRSCVFACDGN